VVTVTGRLQKDAWGLQVLPPVELVAVAGFAVADVQAVLLTHAHTDHHGLAARVRDESGCWVGMHEAESRVLRGMRDGSTVNERNDRWLSMCGVSAEDATGLLMDADRMRGVSALTADRLLGDGATMRPCLATSTASERLGPASR